MAINPYDYMPQPSAGVLLEPCARDGADLAPATAVVIDAIRATTTIVAALAAGARLALAAWRDTRDRLYETLRATWGGAFITGLGLDEDLDACCALDTTEVVPVVRGRPPAVTAG
ncbi:MAG: 2-phosphosulfolactate phosphatase [Phycisphaerae bacterium]